MLRTLIRGRPVRKHGAGTRDTEDSRMLGNGLMPIVDIEPTHCVRDRQ